ncbi:MAG: DUF4347 domain-containing protein, partial [Cyanobacteria bacterium J06626_18]
MNNNTFSESVCVLFVDRAIDGYRRILQELQPGIQAHLLDLNEDGIHQITRILGTDYLEKSVQEIHSDAGEEFIAKLHHFTGATINNVPAGAIATQTSQTMTHQLIAVDTSVADYQAILKDLRAQGDQREVILLDGHEDGVEELAAVLAEHQNVEALHILAHGDVGSLFLGTATLDQTSMQRQYADALAVISQALAPDADVMIYGCQFGQGVQGFIATQTLALMTGANVAASATLTGASALGGDWNLELQVGDVKAKAIAAPSFPGVLSPTTINSDVPITDHSAAAVSLLFIDASVKDYQQLLAGLKPGIQAHLLNPNEDGIHQITQILQSSNFPKDLQASPTPLLPHSPIPPHSIHIVSHGSPGCLYLGNTQLSLDTLPHYTKSLQAWFTPTAKSQESGAAPLPTTHYPLPTTLSPSHPSTPQLFLYGCNVAAGDAGEEFLAKLHHLTGAAIAASSTPIGNAAIGGNWELDKITTPPLPHSSTPLLLHSPTPPFPFHQEALNKYPYTLDPIGLQATFEGLIDYAVTGGSFRTQSNTADPTALGTSASGVLTIPTGATVQSAFLYWAGSGNSADTTVSLDGAPVTASRVFDADFDATEGYFSGFADVTAAVTAKGSGTYTLTDLTVDSGGPFASFSTVMATWGLVVIYEDPAITVGSQINVYDGFELLLNNPNFPNSRTFTLSGLNVPAGATTELTTLIWEGDDNISGTEQVTANGTQFSSPTGGSHDSVSNESGVGAGGPTFGADIDTFDVSSVVNTGDTSLSVGISTGSDQVHVNAFVVKVDNLFVAEIDLNGPDAGEDFTTTFTEGTAPVSVVDTDIEITDVDGSNLQSATIVLTNPQTDDILSVGSLPGGITSAIDTNVPGQITVTLTGPGTLDEYETALQAVTFSNSSDDPDTTNRTVEITVNDGDADSDVVTTTVLVIPVEPPIVDLNSAASDADTDRDFSATFIEGGSAVAIADTDTGIADADGTTIASATVTLTNALTGDQLLVNGTEALTGGSITTTNGTVNFSAVDSGGQIQVSLSSGAPLPLADYEEAIEAISFNNTQADPENTTRTVEVVVNDGLADSNVATSRITVTPDTDGDGVGDAVDIDDDNDGILDSAEQITGFGTGGAFNDGDAVPDGATVFTLGPDGPTPAVNVTTLGGTTTTAITWEEGQFGNPTTAPALADGLLFSFDNAGGTTQADIEIDFGQTVFDAQFTIGDIDGPAADSESITIRAFDGDNNEITLTAANFQNPGSNINLTGTTISSLGAETGDGSVDSSIQVVIPGEVSRIVLEGADPAAGATGNLFFNLNGLAYTADLDTDNDNVVNRLDIDSDNDGIPDNIEAQTTAGYVAPSGIGASVIDADDDGLDDNYDSNTTSTDSTASVGIDPITNTDGVDEVDYLDADSDNDTIDDIAERGDGQPITIISNADADGDGLLDIFEGGTLNDGFDVNDSAIAGDNGGTDGDYSNFTLADTDADTNANEAAPNRTSNDAAPTVIDLDYRDDTLADDFPTATDDTATVDEDDSVNVQVLDNDTAGGDGLASVTITTAPTSGTAIVNDNGTPTDPTDDFITYTPTPDFSGTDSLVYTITDTDGDTSTATVTFTVNEVDDFPTATNDTATLDEDSTVNVPVLGNDTAGGDGLGSVTITTPPVNGTAVINDGGTPTDPTDDTLDFTPNPDFNGTDSLTYTITDTDGDTSTATVTFTVNPVDDFPTATDDTATVDEDSTVNVPILGNDTAGGDGLGSVTITTTG